jgi:hypothetical protein
MVCRPFVLIFFFKVKKKIIFSVVHMELIEDHASRNLAIVVANPWNIVQINKEKNERSQHITGSDLEVFGHSQS